MNNNENGEFVEFCFKKLLIRDDDLTLSDFKKSNITEGDIKKLENKYNIKFPSLFKMYLMAYHYDFYIGFNATAFISDEWEPSYFSYVEHLAQIVKLPSNDSFCGLECWFNGSDTLDDYKNLMANGYIQIGKWGDGWGTLWLKTPVGQDEFDDCELVWFNSSGCESKAMPSFKDFLETFFIGKYDGFWEI